MKGSNLGEFEEFVLLAIRHRGRESSVVDVQDVLKEAGGRRASMGAIYAALDRLHRKGLVESTLGDPFPQRGGKRKRFYTLTPAAEAELVGIKAIRDQLWQVSE